MARSRNPWFVFSGGAASSRRISSVERKCGRCRLLRGFLSALAGFSVVQPSRCPNWKKLRSEARRRAMVVLA